MGRSRVVRNVAVSFNLEEPVTILTRRQLVGRSLAGAALSVVTGFFPPEWMNAQAVPQPTPKPPPLDRDLVRAFVGAAHSDLDKTKSMLGENVGLINATYDWGGGDFETALGGASHMGRPDIAAYLLANGARMDVFCATMMGKIDVVRACVADDPAIVRVKGPHGISLLRHAQIAKQDAMVTLLTASGAS